MPRNLLEDYSPVASEKGRRPRDLLSDYKNNESSALGAFLRSAVHAGPAAINNLTGKLGMPQEQLSAAFNPLNDVLARAGVSPEQAIPKDILENPQDIGHPFAQLLGDIAGFGPVGGATVGLARSVPLWGKIVRAAAPSFIKRAGVHGIEGAGLGALYSPEGQELEGALGGGVLGVALGSVLPWLGKSLPELYRRAKGTGNVEHLEEQAAIARTRHEEAEAEHARMAKILQGIYGKSEPEPFKYDIYKANQQINELHPQTEWMSKNQANLLPNPSEEHLIPMASKELELSEREINEYLGKGKTHDVEAAKEINREVEENKKEIGSLYDHIELDLKNKNVVLSNGRDAKQVMRDISEAFKGGSQNSDLLVKLNDELKAAGKSQEIPADKFLVAYRTASRLAGRTRRDAYKTGISREEHEKLVMKADELDTKVEEMKKVLESGVGKEVLKNLSTANTRWRTEVVPLNRNKAYQDIRNKGRIDTKNIMWELRGTAPGNDILNNIINKSPSLLRNVVGQRYAANPHGLLGASEQELRYINKLPQLQGMLSRLEKTANNLKTAKETSAKYKTINERIEDSLKNHQEKVRKMNKLALEIQEKTHVVSYLEKLLENKFLSKEEKVKVESALKAAKKDRSKLFGLIPHIGSYLLGKGRFLG